MYCWVRLPMLYIVCCTGNSLNIRQHIVLRMESPVLTTLQETAAFLLCIYSYFLTTCILELVMKFINVWNSVVLSLHFWLLLYYVAVFLCFCRVPAVRLIGCGFNPWWGPTEGCNNGTIASWLCTLTGHITQYFLNVALQLPTTPSNDESEKKK